MVYIGLESIYFIRIRCGYRWIILYVMFSVKVVSKDVFLLLVVRRLILDFGIVKKKRFWKNISCYIFEYNICW